MRTITLLVLIMFIFSVPEIGADDGSWNNSFSVQGGSIYSETDHPEIILEKELLVFDGNKTSAVFQFRNTTPRTIKADCGFPVRHEINTIDYGDYLEVLSGGYGGGVINALEWLETEDIIDPEGIEPPGTAILLNDYNNTREFIEPGKISSEIDFSISQDGNQVKIPNLLLERHASRLGAAVTYHFRHNLVFPPGAVSTVRVDYTQNLVSGGDNMSNSYRWDYVIGTGSTWKGPIGSFLLVVPADWDGETPGLEKLIGTDGFNVFGARDYEPARIETFRFFSWDMDYMSLHIFREDTFPAMKKMWQTGSREVMQEIRPVQEFVRTVSASSFIRDRVNVYCADGVVDRAGFDPVAAFDGLDETSWCEGASDDGIGEYLECVLTEPVWALTIKNGFTRFAAEDWMFEYGDFDEYIKDDSLGLKDYYRMNNRVKTLEISSSGGDPVYTLELADRRDSQTFSGIFLEPGTWRFTIRSVYPGSKWKDTCLAELRFVEKPSAKTFKTYLDDTFFRKHLAGFRY